MNRVLVTGATGFVGSHLCKLLVSRGYDVIGTTRRKIRDADQPNFQLKTVGDLGADFEWGPILDGIDYVVHLAARVHVMRDTADDPLDSFRRTNVQGTEQILRHAAAQGVKRLIYLSSVKVNGEATNDQPFSASDTPMPVDPYGQSKLEAEQLVGAVGTDVGLESVIIRPPLVYGPGVGGNFVRLIGLIEKGIPLPFSLVENRRSLVSVQNLSDLVVECLRNSAAPGECFLVSDNEDISTRDLIQMLASLMSRPARLLRVPPAVLNFAAKLTGQSAQMSRLLGSLQVDIEGTMNTLNWKPPVSLDDGIRSTVGWYQQERADA